MDRQLKSHKLWRRVLRLRSGWCHISVYNGVKVPGTKVNRQVSDLVLSCVNVVETVGQFVLDYQLVWLIMLEVDLLVQFLPTLHDYRLTNLDQIQFWLPKVDSWSNFGCQKWTPGPTLAAKSGSPLVPFWLISSTFAAKVGPGFHF